MIKPDILTTAPSNLDFPLWRQLMRDKRDLFTKVFNVFHSANVRISYESFIRTNAPHIEHERVNNFGIDWRHTAVNLALDNTSSEWVLFFEQDFYPLCDDFFEGVFAVADNYDVIGFTYGKPWRKDHRLHPAFLLVRREFVERTTRRFHVVPNHLDHFGIFCNELLDLKPRFANLEDLEYMETIDWYHHNGLCHNMSLVQSGKPANYKVAQLKLYIRNCMKADVPQHPEFLRLCEACLKQEC